MAVAILSTKFVNATEVEDPSIIIPYWLSDDYVSFSMYFFNMF